MIDIPNLLLFADRKSILFGSSTLIIYGLIQIFLGIFLYHSRGLALFLYAFGSLYTITGTIGLRSTKRNSLRMLKVFKVSLLILMTLNFFLICFCVIVCILILVRYNGNCKKHSTFCEEKERDDKIMIIVFFAIPVLFSLGSIVYLRVIYKFTKMYEEDFFKIYNTRFVQPSLTNNLY